MILAPGLAGTALAFTVCNAAATIEPAAIVEETHRTVDALRFRIA